MIFHRRSQDLFKFFILVLPFGMLFWLCPFLSNTQIGNDYGRFSIDHQLELQFSLKNGTFPLYVPGFAKGQSAAALSLGQLYHPISHLASVLPGYWNGNALEWITFLKLIFLGLAHLCLFHLLIRLDQKPIHAFLISFITIYNLRMLDLFRYNAALESYTGLFFVCTAISFYYLKPTPRLGPLWIMGSAYWLICSGHPPLIYFSLMGVFLFILILPFFISTLKPELQPSSEKIFRFYFQVGCCLALSFLLSAAFIVPYYTDFIVSNAGRVEQSYGYSNIYLDTLSGTINNFFFPLLSDVDGAFGGTALLLLVMLIPCLRLVKFKPPYVIWGIWGIILFIFLYMQGHRTIIHYLWWKYLPFGSSIRGPGRISIILPIFFMLGLSWLFHPERNEKIQVGRIQIVSPLQFLGIISLIISILYFFLPGKLISDHTIYAPIAIREIPIELPYLVFGLGLISLIVLITITKKMSGVRFLEYILPLIIIIQIIPQLFFGTWLTEKEKKTSFNQMCLNKQISLKYHADIPGNGFANKIVASHAQKSFFEPYLAKFYRKYRIAKDRDHAYRLSYQDRSPSEVIVEGYSVPSMPIKKPNFSEVKPDRVKLVYASFNRLVFKVWCQTDGFFGISYPFLKQFRAFVNNEETKIYRANGAHQAIWIAAGEHEIEFRFYSLGTLIGFCITLSTLCLIGMWLGWSFNPFLLKMSFSLISIIFCAWIFYVWHNSLYHGKNLATHYSWSSETNATGINFAYGKKTQMSSNILFNYNYIFASGEAVDGYNDGYLGSITSKEKNPWWLLDLNEEKKIKKLVIYEASDPRFRPINSRPLRIVLSQDGKTGMVSLVNSSTSPIIIEFEPVERARYIIIQANGLCHLGLSEVEVSPP